MNQHHYRRTDESHVDIAAGIARAHDDELRTTALEQLVGLYARGAHPFRASARNTLLRNLDRVRDRLQEMAGNGHHEASALLGYGDPDHVSPEAAQAAAQRLSEPTTNGPGGFGTGTGAVNDSLLAAVLPVEQRIPCIEMLLTNAASPWEPSSNQRGSRTPGGSVEYGGIEYGGLPVTYSLFPTLLCGNHFGVKRLCR